MTQVVDRPTGSLSSGGAARAQNDRAPRLPPRHVAVLGVLVLVGLLRGLFWVAATEVWNPMDEAQHYAFVQSMATGKGIPTVGKDRISPEVLRLTRESPTLWFRSLPRPVDVDDPVWASDRDQYEAVQPPLYYAAVAPVYLVSRPFGVLASIYALRVVTLLLSLLAVPVAWVLARELFPRWPAVWLLAPALLVGLQGFNMTLASVTNDGLLVPAAGVALLGAARLRRDLTWRRAAVAGLLLGAAVLVKTNVVGLAPLIVVMLVASAVAQRQRLTSTLAALAALTASAAVVVLPWVAWNQLTYGAPTASGALDAIRTFNWARQPFTFEVLRAHIERARMGFWDGQLRGMGINPYSLFFEKATVVAITLGILAILWRRQRREGWSLVWIAAALPVTFIGMEVIIQVFTDGAGEPYGRHLYAALVAVAVAIAAGLVSALGPRWGTVAVLAVVAFGVTREQTLVHHYVADAYTTGLVGSGLAPVVDQSLNERNVVTGAIRADPPCPVEVVGLLLPGQPPDTVTVSGGGSVQQARQAGTDDTTFGQLFGGGQAKITLYRLETPVDAPFELRFPPTDMGSARTLEGSGLSFADGPGEPVGRLYCGVADPPALRFSQLYGPNHPPGISYGQVRAWPAVWAVVAWLAVAVAAVMPVARRLLTPPFPGWSRRRGTPGPTGSDDQP